MPDEDTPKKKLTVEEYVGLHVDAKIREHFTVFPDLARLSRMAGTLAIAEYFVEVYNATRGPHALPFIGFDKIFELGQAASVRTSELISFGFTDPPGLEAMYFHYKDTIGQYLAVDFDLVEEHEYPTSAMRNEAQGDD